MSTTETVTTASMPVDAVKTKPTKLNYVKLPQTSFSPGTASAFRREHDVRDVHITDARSVKTPFDFNKHGFKFLEYPRGEQDIANEQKVKANMYPEIIELLKKETGATRVFPFSHIIRLERWEDGAEVAKEKADQDSVPLKTPARFVHVDHSYVGAPTVLHDNMTPEDAETLSKTRWGIINIWRPVNHAVTRDPLAICDAQSVAEKDLVGAAFEDVSRGAGFETWHITYSPEHRWYYMSEMTPDELLMIKIFDSKVEGTARRTPHSAFTAPDDHGPTRNSIEVRCLVFWEDQSVE